MFTVDLTCDQKELCSQLCENVISSCESNCTVSNDSSKRAAEKKHG